MSDQMKAEFAAKIAASVATGLVQWVLVPVGVWWRDCVPADTRSLVVSFGVEIETAGCEGCILYTVWGTTPDDVEWVLQVLEVPARPAVALVW
jgi:hypothetical protein